MIASQTFSYEGREFKVEVPVDMLRLVFSSDSILRKAVVGECEIEWSQGELKIATQTPCGKKVTVYVARRFMSFIIRERESLVYEEIFDYSLPSPIYGVLVRYECGGETINEKFGDSKFGQVELTVFKSFDHRISKKEAFELAQNSYVSRFYQMVCDSV